MRPTGTARLYHATYSTASLIAGRTFQWPHEPLLLKAGFRRLEWIDESLAPETRLRFVALPVRKPSSAMRRALLYAATREDVRYLGLSIFVAAWK